MNDVEKFGQVFTPQSIVSEMLLLRKNFGRTLEPACGSGAFFNNIPNCVGIEIDETHCPAGAMNIDFFDYPATEKYDTVIGNPPYVRFRDIDQGTKKKLDSRLFDERSNLYLFFIEKCINHLNDKGELIFITPRDFLKATSSIKLNKFIYDSGTITDVIDLGDKHIFQGFSPNCIIFRFEKGNYSRKTNVIKEFTICKGQLLFTENTYHIPFNDVFFVKVGAVSGCDRIFANEEFGNKDFVFSSTCKTGKTRRMIYGIQNDYLLLHKNELLNRRIRHFDETNWAEWGRNLFISAEKRIYVNTKTRNPQPFFLHSCNNYDGSVLAVFPKNQDADLLQLCNNLNNVDWAELGFVCDGRYIFSQKSLENTILPGEFSAFAEE